MNAQFTQTTQFGVSNGPTYSGQNSVPVSGSDVVRNYPGTNCLHGVTTTIDASGFLVANWLAMGFAVKADSTQTGTPSAAQQAAASVTIHLVDGLSGGATDYTIPLTVGQAVSWVTIPPTLAHNVTEITVVGDTYVDVDVFGLVVLTA